MRILKELAESKRKVSKVLDRLDLGQAKRVAASSTRTFNREGRHLKTIAGVIGDCRDEREFELAGFVVRSVGECTGYWLSRDQKVLDFARWGASFSDSGRRTRTVVPESEVCSMDTLPEWS